MALDTLIHLDQQLLLWFNGSDSPFLDQLMLLFTSGLTWIPLYIALCYMIVKNNETMLQISLVIGCALLCVLLTSLVDNGIVKPMTARLRPCNDPAFKELVNLADNYHGSGFSFFSAHAANTMSLAVFLILLVRSKMLSVTLVLWSLLNCWTRLYLGVHYPSDIVVGLLWGVVVGTVGYIVFHKLYFRFSPKINYISSQYTSTGYAITDIDVVMLALSATLTVCVLMSVPVFA
jgi:undecaprenyl-diphosphatase